ncbi:hypothetical protein ACWV26_12080 [Rummeliibacillus sp. JY-2-4R]
MKHIGKAFEYYTWNGQKQIAICKKIEFHQVLRKPIFIGVSLSGNKVRLSKDEIYRFV